VTDRGSLRHRIIAAYVLLACVVCSAFAAAALHAIGRVEDRLIDQRLARTADQYALRKRQGLGMDLPPGVTLYRGDAIPAAIRDLPAGRREVVLGGKSLNMLVRGEGEQAFALTDDDADFEAIQWQLHAFLAAALIACLGLAVLLGRWTASHVISPLTLLARAVDQDLATNEFPALTAQDEIGVLARAFAARTQALQQVLLRERYFVADVSHELRTPLTVILGAAEVLGARVTEHSELATVVERIRRTAADTADRVGALLLLSQAPETLDMPWISIAPIVRLEMERSQPLLHGKPVSMSFELIDDVLVQARAELAGTAVGNLIRNACQYTEQGSVTIRLERDRLLVEDTGIGIPLPIRQRVFDRYVRADPGSPTGSGLGLAIVQRVALHQGWRVSLEDRLGEGSRFVLNWSSGP
jgi:signal transduction histidine kinase